jgi:hypothetical protein
MNALLKRYLYSRTFHNLQKELQNSFNKKLTKNTMNFLKTIGTALCLLAVFACIKENSLSNAHLLQNTSENSLTTLAAKATPAFSETFESGTKTSYTTANVTLSTGSWSFNDALLGNSSSDVKDGSQSARVRNSGKLVMEFNHKTGASVVTVKHARYGSDGNSTWQLWYSVNSGSSFIQAGSTITTSSSTLQTATFTINVSGNIRFEILKTDGSSNRINFDDFSFTDYAVSNPAPSLTAVSPDSTVAGGAAFVLTVTGKHFINGSTIDWNGVALTTVYTDSTKLTATVPATDIATGGTASITVVTPAPGGGTTSPISFIIKGKTTGKRFLFDNTKAETAGNADWVIDEDNSTPQRIPTPAQSTITASTVETYWTGALSSWGIALVKAGDNVETLPTTGAITYGNTSNAQDLSNYDVFVVDEPNILFTAAEKTAILNFVQHGGGLFMISDHTQSDRNNDGYDSPEIWNDLMTNNTVQSNPFGFSIDLTNISEVTTNVLTASASNPILTGSQGTVSKLEFDNGATITINPSSNASVQGLIWQGAYAQTNTNIMCASSTFGSGRVFVITDSSPMDDGTGAPGNTLYVGWTVDSHAALFMNASLWLAQQQ